MELGARRLRRACEEGCWDVQQSTVWGCSSGAAAAGWLQPNGCSSWMAAAEWLQQGGFAAAGFGGCSMVNQLAMDSFAELRQAYIVVETVMEASSRIGRYFLLWLRRK